MYCEKCGNRLNEGDKFCSVCQNPIIQQDYSNSNNSSSIENVNNKAEGWRRIVAVLIDGVLLSIIWFFLFTLVHVIILLSRGGMSYESDMFNGIYSFFQMIFPIMFFLNPMLGHSLIMSLAFVKNSLGNRIMKIKIKNLDGSDPKKIEFVKQFWLNILFSLVSPIVLVSGIICIVSSEGQLLSDMLLKIKAYKE